VRFRSTALSEPVDVCSRALRLEARSDSGTPGAVEKGNAQDDRSPSLELKVNRPRETPVSEPPHRGFDCIGNVVLRKKSHTNCNTKP